MIVLMFKKGQRITVFHVWCVFVGSGKCALWLYWRLWRKCLLWEVLFEERTSQHQRRLWEEGQNTIPESRNQNKRHTSSGQPQTVYIVADHQVWPLIAAPLLFERSAQAARVHTSINHSWPRCYQASEQWEALRRWREGFQQCEGQGFHCHATVFEDEDETRVCRCRTVECLHGEFLSGFLLLRLETKE